jgi:hypothetical protein
MTTIIQKFEGDAARDKIERGLGNVFRLVVKQIRICRRKASATSRSNPC